MMITVRLRHLSGSSTLSLNSTQSFASLQDMIFDTTSIAPSFQELRIGFPPKVIVSASPRSDTLESLGIRQGETIVVSQLSEAASVPKPVTASTSSTIPRPTAPASASKVAAAPTASSTAAKKKNLNGSFVEVDEGRYLVLRVVPDDNSCLFHAMALLVEPARQNPVPHLRQAVATYIRASPETWSEGMLGQTPESYISAITRSNTWGGAIELSCLAAVYNVEICSIDVMSGRIDRFNSEGRSSIILIYSGIHYDALTLSFLDPSLGSTLSHTAPDESLAFDLTSFSGEEKEMVLSAALKLVETLKKDHYYTDAATFTLKCEICNTAIVGEKEARQHAEQTGHANFGEYSD